MPFVLSIIIPLVQALQEGGQGESPIPVYQLRDLYWWGALLLIGLIIFIAWLLISWQARYFDGQMQLAGSHAAESQVPLNQAPAVSSSPERFSPQGSDDLTLIEGIGPVISRQLQSRGITTFAQLAQTDREDLDRFLKEANLRLANTSTWAEQARLAAAGDFDGLRTYQSHLKGGREV